MNTSLNLFVVADPKKCIGCKVCEVACAATHAAPASKTVGALVSPLLPRLYLVRMPEVTTSSTSSARSLLRKCPGRSLYGSV